MTNEQSERESVIKELDKIMPCSCIDAYKLRNLSAPDCCNCNYVEDIADFVLNDRKRICAPIYAYKLSVIETDQSWGLRKSDRAINETLILAGINKETE